MRIPSSLALALSLVTVAACALPDVDFNHGDPDAATDAPTDAPTEVDLAVSAMNLAVNEGGQTTFTVALTAPPPAVVLVSIDSADDNRVGVTPSSVSFDDSNWDQPRTITVSGREDADTENEAVTVTASSSVGDATVEVTVNDNDDLSIVAAPAAGLDVTEGETASITVHLSAQPSGPVTVDVVSSDPAVATLDPPTLTFGTGTWELDQIVVVTGVDDADTVGATAMITLSATGLDDTVVPLQVIDDDVLGILPSTTNLGVLAEGGSTSFTVRLTQQPTSPVTVAVASSDGQLLTAAPPMLTFDGTTWSTPQTVTVNLPQDVDTTDETATITLSAAGLMPRTVSATIDDDDVQVVQAGPSPLNLIEGMNGTVNVRLAFQPASDVTLSVTSLDPALATAGPASLTFTPSNYDQNQAVTVGAVQDVDAISGMTSVRIESVAAGLSRDVSVNVTDDDQLLIETSVPIVTLGESGMATFGVRLTAAPSATVTVNASSGDPTAATVAPTMLTFTPADYATYQMVTVSGVADVDLAAETLTITLSATGIPNRTVDASVTDDDMQVVLMTPPSLTVNEGGSGTVAVTLGFLPTANTTVTVTSGDVNAATVSPGTLLFTPGNYATAQNVTITGVGDADIDDDSVTISGTAPGATGASVAVTVADDDQLGIESNVTTITVGEAGTASVGVRLTAQPSGNVVVTVISSDPMAATAMPAMLTFTTGNWSTYQNVTLTGVADADAADDNITLSLMATGLTTRTVNVTVDDDDTQDILLTATTVSLSESGTATFGVRLAAMPTSSVTVTVASANAGKATAGPTPLTFTSANYATDQTVTVTGVADLDLANDMVTINLSSTGLPTRSVTASITDDDMQEVVASSAGPLTVVEGGPPVTVGFSLRYVPAANVVVSIAAGTGVSVMPASLTFTPGNHGTAQNVMVTGVPDANAADVTTSVVASATGATSAVVSVIVDDDEVLELDVSATNLTVAEGGSSTFSVRLSAQPTAATTVTLGSNDVTTATVTPSSLSFSTGNWNTFQSVTVNGVQDGDLTNDAATITVSSTGLPSRNVGVTVTDDDMLTINVNPGTITVAEGQNGMVGVTLSHQPAANVVVTVSSGDPTAVTVPAPAQLTFTTSNWNVAQNAVVTAVDDADVANESVTVSLTSASAPTRTFTVNTIDDDVLLTDLSVQMDPGGANPTPITFTGTGFVPPLTASIGGTAIGNQQVVNATTITGTPPAHAAGNPRFAEARVTRNASSFSAIPRAYYYGTWRGGTAGLSGGDVHAVVTPGSLTFAGTDNGVYVSTSSGQTWSPASVGLPAGPVHALATDPQNTQHLWAGTDHGIYETVNGGQSWDQKALPFEGVNCLTVGVNGTMYACTLGGRVVRSTDGGSTWNPALVAFATAIAIAPGQNNNVWVASNLGVHTSTNGGQSFELTNAGLGTGPNGLALLAQSTSTIFVGTDNGVFRSVNGGFSWSAANGNLGDARCQALAQTSSSTQWCAGNDGNVYRTFDQGQAWTSMSSGLPAMGFSNGIRAIAVRTSGPAPELYVGTSYWGVYRSTNQGSSWLAATAGIESFEVVDLAAHPGLGGHLLMAPEGMGIWRSTDHGASWTAVNAGLTSTMWRVYDLDYSTNQPSVVWAAFHTMGVRRSADGGASWQPTGPIAGPVLGVAGVDAQTAYAACATGAYKTINGGIEWVAVGPGLPSDELTSIAVMGPQVFVVAPNGIHRSDDEGASWNPSNSGINGTVTQVWADAANHTVYAQTTLGTYASSTGGTSWTLLTTTQTQSFAIDPQRDATVYFGAVAGPGGGGVRRTLTAGSTVVPFTEGLPAGTSCARLAVDKDGTAVYCGTRDRGMYRLPPF